MHELESEGKTVAEAVENALAKMGLRRDQVEVQILSEGSSGFMGLGARPARVRLTEKHWGTRANEPAAAPSPHPRRSAAPAEASLAPRRRAPLPAEPQRQPQPAARTAVAAAPPEPAAATAEAKKLLEETLALMGFCAQAEVVWDKAQERVKAVVSGADAERLAASDGRVLEALQFLTTLMLTRHFGQPVAAQVDAAGHWEKREKDIMAQVERGIAQVKATGKPFRLEPMDAATRRLIHRSLAENPDVETFSEGEGAWRKVVLRPRRK